MTKRKYKDYSGEVIGDLTCIGASIVKTKGGRGKQEYICSCGNKRVADRSYLKTRYKEGKPVSCGCKNPTKNLKDITGVSNNRLTAIKNTGEKSYGNYLWLFKCECGGTVKTTSSRFLSGKTKSCGCLLKDSCKAKKTTHGLRGTPAYNSWQKIKQRCFDEKNPYYHYYGGKGLTMDKIYADDFLEFLKEVGDRPADHPDYSIDRIDNTKGYVKGNMRWASPKQQARNRGSYKKGKTVKMAGVHIDNKKYKSKDKYYAVATWCELDGTSKSRAFSFNKYGSELALFLAQEYRTTMMERLNLLGAGYSHYHIYGEVADD